MLAEGFTTRRGRRGALIHHDAVNRCCAAARGARLTALTSGGTIPDTADYQVLLEPENQIIGTVNEDFAVESLAGRRLPARQHRLPHPARRARHGAGRGRRRACRRTSRSGSARRPAAATSCRDRCRACAEIERARAPALALPACGGGVGERRAAIPRSGMGRGAGERAPLARRRARPRRAGGAPARRIPRRGACRARRAADPARRSCSSASSTRSAACSWSSIRPIGSRINRAWGLALRKRFCRKFNFELQAAATEDNIVLSLTTAHSFELAEVPALPAFGERAATC